MTVGGIPLIYLGDEIGTLNDYSYLDHPDHKHDSRWVHRSTADPQAYALRTDPKTNQGQVYLRIRAIIEFRKGHQTLAGGALEVIWTENECVLGYTRVSAQQRLGIFANFSEQEQQVSARVIQQNNLSHKQCLFGEGVLNPQGNLVLGPLDFVIFG